MSLTRLVDAFCRQKTGRDCSALLLHISISLLPVWSRSLHPHMASSVQAEMHLAGLSPIRLQPVHATLGLVAAGVHAGTRSRQRKPGHHSKRPARPRAPEEHLPVGLRHHR